MHLGERQSKKDRAFVDDPVPSSRCNYSYFSELLTDVNTLLRLVPRPFTATMIAIEMPAAIRPYSMAVAPDSSLQNLETSFIFLALICPGTKGYAQFRERDSEQTVRSYKRGAENSLLVSKFLTVVVQTASAVDVVAGTCRLARARRLAASSSSRAFAGPIGSGFERRTKPCGAWRGGTRR